LCYRIGRELGQEQWHCQHTADALAQHGHTKFVLTSVQNKEAFGGIWGHVSTKTFGILHIAETVTAHTCPQKAIAGFYRSAVQLTHAKLVYMVSVQKLYFCGET